MRDNITILIAEDDEGNFILTKSRIKRAGITNPVVRFANGQQTLDYLHSHCDHNHPDQPSDYVLLLDIRMPKVDGLEVMSQIRDNYALKKIPIIVISASDNPDSVRQCKALGCKAYIVKPVDNTLVDMIEKVSLPA